MNKQTIIQKLQLEAHVEGGYFKRTYTAKMASANPARSAMSSIYYLLTDDQPIGHFNRNQSDIIHYWHMGSALSYWLIDREGQLSKVILGPDLSAGQQLQLTVPGGFWKATQLENGSFGLLSEAVTPEFDYQDMELGNAEQMQISYPALWPKIKHFCKHASTTVD